MLSKHKIFPKYLIILRKNFFTQLSFIIKNVFFKKRLMKNYKDSYSLNTFENKNGEIIEIYENKEEQFPSDFLTSGGKHNINKDIEIKIQKFLPNITDVFDIGSNIGIWTIPKILLYNKDVKY